MLPAALVVLAVLASDAAFGLEFQGSVPLWLTLFGMLATPAIILATPALLCLGTWGLAGRASVPMRATLALLSLVLVVATGILWGPGEFLASLGVQLPPLLGSIPLLFPTRRGGWPSRGVALLFGAVAITGMAVVLAGAAALTSDAFRNEHDAAYYAGWVGFGGIALWVAMWAAYAAGAWWIDASKPSREAALDPRDATIDELFGRGIIDQEQRSSWHRAKRISSSADQVATRMTQAHRHTTWLRLIALFAILPALLGGIGLLEAAMTCEERICKPLDVDSAGPLGLVFLAYSLGASIVVLLGAIRPDATVQHATQRPSIDAEYERILRLAHARARSTSEPVTQQLEAQ